MHDVYKSGNGYLDLSFRIYSWTDKKHWRAYKVTWLLQSFGNLTEKVEIFMIKSYEFRKQVSWKHSKCLQKKKIRSIILKSRSRIIA